MSRIYKSVHDVQYYYKIKSMIRRGETENALGQIHHLNGAQAADKLLSLIGRKAIEQGNIPIAERAGRRMNWASNADSLLKDCVAAYLSRKGNTEKALGPVGYMNWASSADDALRQIGRKALDEGNIPVAERAAKKMNYASNATRLWKEIYRTKN